MPIRRTDRHDTMRDDWGLVENPYRISAIYSPDNPDPYEKLIYGEQYQEFYEKFFLRPLEKDSNRQVVGALWSNHDGANKLGKGHGKSMLMAEESKSINADLGAGKLREFGISEPDIEANPFVAGYCTFDKSKDISTFPAALLDAVKFILGSKYASGGTVHQELRRRIAERIDAEPGFETEHLQRRLERALRGYQGLSLQLSHPKVHRFIEHLSMEQTAPLLAAINDIGPRIKAAQGFHFVHIFNTFLLLADVCYVVYFIDQIENFAKYTRKQDQDIRILRESMCQTSPTREIASFIFQMHIEAQHGIEDWWENIEHLPSLDAKKRINATRIVDLKGLTSKREALLLAKKYLEAKRHPGYAPPTPIHPFDDDIIEEVRRTEHGNPRKFLEKLGAILDHAVTEHHAKLDLAYVQPLLEDIPEAISPDEDEEGAALVNPER